MTIQFFGFLLQIGSWVVRFLNGAVISLTGVLSLAVLWCASILLAFGEDVLCSETSPARCWRTNYEILYCNFFYWWHDLHEH